MPGAPLLYYITDRTAFAADEPIRRRRLLDKIAESVRAGIDYIQLREKDLSTRELEPLAREALSIIAQLRTENQELRTALLINSRTDVALAVGAAGVHLRSDDISPQEVRQVWEPVHVGTATDPCGAGTPARENLPSAALIGVSCHSPEEVAQAAVNGATFAVLAPIFEKKDAPDTRPAGLDKLRAASKAAIPVLALGGVTLTNARSCLDAGAQGVAAIRLFQENEIAEIVRKLQS